MKLEFSKIREGLGGLSNQLINSRKRVQQEYGSVKYDDFRISVLSKANNHVGGVHVGIVGFQVLMSNSPEHPQLLGSSPDVEVYVSQFDNLIKGSFAEGLFVSMESSWRGLMREFHKGCKECKGGLAGFYKLRTCLLKDIGLDEADSRRRSTLLRLVALIRNAIHNNYIYFPDQEGAKDESLIYDGKTYDFRIGKAIDFLDWDFHFAIAGHLGQLLEEVSLNPKIKALPYIPDFAGEYEGRDWSAS